MHLKSLIKSCFLSEKFSFQKSQKVDFCGKLFMQRERRTKMFPLNKMMGSLNSTYCKSFSFLSFKMEKFQKSIFDWETLTCLQIWTYSQGFQNFLNPQLCLHGQVLQTHKFSFHSQKVDVNSGTLSKESPSSFRKFLPSMLIICK